MNTKILFLDFDGVVNNIGTRSGMGLNIPFKCYDEKYMLTDWGFENIGVFNQLLLWCLENNVKIVISSSWRICIGYAKEFNEFFDTVFHEYFWLKKVNSLDSLVIDTTSSTRTNRELEIKEWLEKNKYNGKFVILDDDVCYGNKYFKDKHIVKTNNKVGLTKVKLEEIKRKLKD
jgi:hypothetical protein|nr:MAG TPA: HAD domain protein [Ackermannviridae sp.]